VTAQTLTYIFLTFVLAGIVKGVTGMGLPTGTLGLLGLLMPPAESAALVIAPSLVTNIWQFALGPDRRTLLRRLWPMLLVMAVATVAAAGLLTSGHAAGAAIALGAVLMIYAIIGLAKIHVAVGRPAGRRGDRRGDRRHRGLRHSGRPVFPGDRAGKGKSDPGARPVVLGLDLALAAGLASRGAFHLGAAGASLLCTVPVLVGVLAGQWLRQKIDPETFRRLFFLGLLLLGADLTARSAF
jgi:uncharacterized membrane protein YfcA